NKLIEGSEKSRIDQRRNPFIHINDIRWGAGCKKRDHLFKPFTVEPNKLDVDMRVFFRKSFCLSLPDQLLFRCYVCDGIGEDDFVRGLCEYRSASLLSRRHISFVAQPFQVRTMDL